MNEVAFGQTDFLEELKHIYEYDRLSVDSSWRALFEHHPDQNKSSPFTSQTEDARLLQLIQAYRQYGYLGANLNPIALHQKEMPPQLKAAFWGFQEEDLQRLFSTGGLLPQKRASLEEILNLLQELYCGRIGWGFYGWVSPEMESWLKQQIENRRFLSPLSLKEKKKIFHDLNRSELFETFLHTKYVGQKRFSLEGGEALIPMLSCILDEGLSSRVLEEAAIGMTHRGRLNVMANILNKSYSTIFAEFHETYMPAVADAMGDVRYHMGYAAEYGPLDGEKLHVTLLPNPSHLESVGCVMEGLVRVKQEQSTPSKVLPIWIHGDASLSGQGVVYETLQLSRLPGYTTQGTIHIVLNNQIGFTTIPRDLRSTAYCSDIARAFAIPILFVNGEDPEACFQAAKLAFELRCRFQSDVFIELNCYRKYGHNEGDEPAYTQPLEYQIIRQKTSIRQLYKNELLKEGLISSEELAQLEHEFKKGLQEAHAATLQEPLQPIQKRQNQELSPISLEELLSIGRHLTHIPPDFHVHPKLEQLLQVRLNMVEGRQEIDWSMAELLALGVLLWRNISIRFSGQDSCRGTFSQRHAMWVDQQKEQEYYPLAHLKAEPGKFSLFNSPLSEMALLGFEYGYSIAHAGLTIWEAQFGDFANGAQIIIDQYIASGEQKWGQTSKLTLLLPHGYEGQGPEHSSGRLERFLALAGHENMIIAYPTTPVQFFHLLVRQGFLEQQKPLIVFTPKGLLRHPSCRSHLREFHQEHFYPILEEYKQKESARVLILCSGRFYYDLLKAREEFKRDDHALIRLEQLYPLEEEVLMSILKSYSRAVEWKWVQEEPENMGALSYIEPILKRGIPQGIQFSSVARERSSTPATGSHYKHEQEQQALLLQAFQ